MFDSLLSSLFRCSHNRITFPQTLRGARYGQENSTYIVCLDCGKKFTYDWSAMRAGHEIRTAIPDKRAAYPSKPFAARIASALKYIAWALALPAAWFAARAGRRKNGALNEL